MDVQHGGHADAAVMWFELQLAEDVTFSSRDSKIHQHWRRIAQTLHTPMDLQIGAQVNVTARHDRYYDFLLAT